MPSIIYVKRQAEFHKEAADAECRYADCRYADCRYAECRGAILTIRAL
jgi:hypothetical protein